MNGVQYKQLTTPNTNTVDNTRITIQGDNIFRAVENGFTLFKCSLNGMSGAVDPYGRTLASKPTTWGEVYTAQIPVQKHVWTLYAHGGKHWVSIFCKLAFFPPKGKKEKKVVTRVCCGSVFARWGLALLKSSRPALSFHAYMHTVC